MIKAPAWRTRPGQDGGQRRDFKPSRAFEHRLRLTGIAQLKLLKSALAAKLES
jgi:hypothetical protein